MELSTALIQKISDYRPDPAKLAQVQNVPILTLSGTTGAGKGALMARLLAKYPYYYHLFISHTTRAPRLNNGKMEQNGVEYHFVDLPTLEHMIDEHEFIEVKRFASKVYGSSIAELAQTQREHKTAVNDIDIQGIEEYHQLGLDPKSVFVLPPSFDEWMRRLAARGPLTPAELQLRLQAAEREISEALRADYFYLIVNDDLDNAVDEIHAVAQAASRPNHVSGAFQLGQAMLQELRRAL